MTDTSVRKITPADFDAVLDVLVRAFDDDPWFSFVATQDRHREERLRGWLRRSLVQRTYPYGETYVTSDGRGRPLESAGAEPHRPARRGRAVARAAPHLGHPARTRGTAGDPAAQRASGRGPARRAAHPRRPPAIAGARDRDGTRPAHARAMGCAGLGVALHCTKERNVNLYRHFGFEVTETTATPDGPTLWGMWREPRAAL